jgi:hypothetical protein
MNNQMTLDDVSAVQAPPPDQPLLFSPEIEQLVAEQEKATGVYTAERFKERRPQDYQAVTILLAGPSSLRKIADLFKIHHRTVAAIREREPVSIDTLRSKRVQKILTAVDLQLDRLLENPDSVPYNVAGLLISQLIDKAELLEGRATSRKETVEKIDIHGTWEEVLQGLPTEKLANAREIGPEIGLVGETREAIEPAVLQPGPPAGPRPQLEAGPPSDTESAVSQGDRSEPAQSDTVSDTDPNRSQAPIATAGPSPDARNAPGGGDSAGSDARLETMDYTGRKFLGNGPSNRRPLV